MIGFVFFGWFLQYVYSFHAVMYTSERQIKIETQWATCLLVSQIFCIDHIFFGGVRVDHLFSLLCWPIMCLHSDNYFTYFVPALL